MTETGKNGVMKETHCSCSADRAPVQRAPQVKSKAGSHLLTVEGTEDSSDPARP